MSRLTLDSSLSKLSLNDSSVSWNIILVDSEDKLLHAVKTISKYKMVAFDAEGVNLSRRGKLTIATFQGIDEHSSMEETNIFVVDVQVIGSERVFSTSLPSFRPVLEDEGITKLTFDCRSDSDALYHQCSVCLAGVLELQVLDQAVRIYKGELPPKRKDYLKNNSIPYLDNMEKVLIRNNIHIGIDKASAPHKYNFSVWKERPISNSLLIYAAKDVHAIGLLWIKLSEVKLPDNFKNQVTMHSKRYEQMFRERDEEVNFLRDKEFTLEEHAIISESELPPDHPRRPREGGTTAEQKWNKAVIGLHSNQPSSTIYSDVLFVLQHNYWYTEKGYNEIRELCKSYPYFTGKQRYRIANPPTLKDEDEIGYNDGYDGDY